MKRRAFGGRDACDPKCGFAMRVRYPMGFYVKWMDDRIDNPNTGWKGRGLWKSTDTRTPFHMEGGKGIRPKG